MNTQTFADLGVGARAVRSFGDPFFRAIEKGLEGQADGGPFFFSDLLADERSCFEYVDHGFPAILCDSNGARWPLRT